ncbi:MAG: diguanylate cyclase [Gammaproteobacteria bacterium]
MRISRSKNLFVLFTVSSLVSVTVILAAVYIGIRHIYQQHIIASAESESVGIGSALFRLENEVLTAGNPGGASSLEIAPQDFGVIDRRMRSYLQPFNILKIKVFNREREIIYSTDPSITGHRDGNNPRLETALAGKPVSKLNFKDRVMDLSEEERFGVDVVETYLPVTNDSGQVIGSFEIYLDVTHYRERQKGILWSSMLAISAILFATFGVLFVIMRKGTQQLGAYENRLHGLAVTDELTGLANRRHLMRRAEEEFLRAQRSGEAKKVATRAGCILIDLDHFKKVNDTYGHQAGDQVLREVAKRLHRVVRRYDVVGRYGGEEFLIVTPNSDFETTQTIAQRARGIIREEPFQFLDKSSPLTASIGFAITEPSDENVEEVIKRADEGLYLAKSSGRDCVRFVDISGSR